MSHMYGGKSDWLVNLGYSKKPVREITLYLPRVGSYSLDDMSVVVQPMDEFDGQIDALKEDVLDNIFGSSCINSCFLSGFPSPSVSITFSNETTFSKTT